MVSNHEGDLAAVTRWFELLRQLSLCTRGLRRSLGEMMVQRHGLNESQLLLLWSCAAAPGGLGQHELADALALSPPQISGLVQQLVERGLVVGHRSPEDRRRQVCRLTKQGRTAVDAATDDVARWAQKLDTSLAPREVQRLARPLAALCTKLASGEPPQVPSRWKAAG